jgi:hypothetical protein
MRWDYRFVLRRGQPGPRLCHGRGHEFEYHRFRSDFRWLLQKLYTNVMATRSRVDFEADKTALKNGFRSGEWLNTRIAGHLGITASGSGSICSRRHPSHAIHAFREPNGLFELPIFQIQDLDGASLGTTQIRVCAVGGQRELSRRG